MPPSLRVRALTEEERCHLEPLTRSRTAATRAVERAQIIWAAHGGATVATIAQELGVCGHTVRTWIKRFNALGLAGLDDCPRSGRPATYTAELSLPTYALVWSELAMVPGYCRIAIQ